MHKSHFPYTLLQPGKSLSTVTAREIVYLGVRHYILWLLDNDSHEGLLQVIFFFYPRLSSAASTGFVMGFSSGGGRVKNVEEARRSPDVTTTIPLTENTTPGSPHSVIHLHSWDVQRIPGGTLTGYALL